MQEQYLTTTQVSEILQLNVETVYDMVRDGYRQRRSADGGGSMLRSCASGSGTIARQCRRRLANKPVPQPTPPSRRLLLPSPCPSPWGSTGWAATFTVTNTNDIGVGSLSGDAVFAIPRLYALTTLP